MRVKSLLVCLGIGACTGSSEPADPAPKPPVDRMTRRCATPTPTADEIAAVNARMKHTANAAPRPPGSVRIRVFIHEIRDGFDGRMSDYDIGKQIEILNDAFRGRQPNPGVVTDTPAATAFTFTLAGHTITDNPVWFTAEPDTTAERAMKTALRQGDARDLNVYTSQPGGDLLGWATFPWELYQGDRSDALAIDGVVIFHGTMSYSADAGAYDLGDTLVHEVGHWLGLFHTFGYASNDGCEPPGDEVDDTPSEQLPTYGCPSPIPDTCGGGGPDPIYNFMDYTDDVCMFGFTAGQAERMDRFEADLRRPCLDVVCPDDNDACTIEGCDGRTNECYSTPVYCDDDNACTVTGCDPATGCIVITSNGHCDDFDACTTELCDAVLGCSSTPITCDDGDACTLDGCDSATGCTAIPTGEHCTDSDACTADACDPVLGCTSTPISCDDGDACTVDDCDATTGCASTPIACDDGNTCTLDSCAPASGCAFAAAPAGTACAGGHCNDDGHCVLDGPTTVHVGDLDGASQRQGQTWAAKVRVVIHTGAHANTAGVTISGKWNGGPTATCTTNDAGRCTVTLDGIPKTTAHRRFAITGASAASLVYEPSQNHDLDGTSDGTAVIVTRP